jgi:hypothetical protein
MPLFASESRNEVTQDAKFSSRNLKDRLSAGDFVRGENHKIHAFGDVLML